MDAHKIALATRMNFLRLDRGCQAAAEELWAGPVTSLVWLRPGDEVELLESLTEAGLIVVSGAGDADGWS